MGYGRGPSAGSIAPASPDPDIRGCWLRGAVASHGRTDRASRQSCATLGLTVPDTRTRQGQG